jgi:cell division protein FtsL
MSQAIAKSLPGVGLRLQRPRLLPLLMFIFLLALISLFFVWSRIQVINFEYDISRLEGALRAGRQQNQQLRLESASLRSPSRIERIARQKLGLHTPSAQQVIMVKK